MSKLVAHVTRFGKTDYTAQDLASVLGVTVRSTHRFLLAWLDCGLIEIIGEEKGKSKGRPKQIYRLSFLNELVR
jgi:predicted ArsR family transcriptional regulator